MNSKKIWLKGLNEIETLCSRDIIATYKFSNVSLEYDSIFDVNYVIMIGDLYAGTTSIQYAKAISIHYDSLSKKDTIDKIEVNNLSVLLLQDIIFLQFSMFPWKFSLPQVKWHLISSVVNGVCELPHKLWNNLRVRILGN